MLVTLLAALNPAWAGIHDLAPYENVAVFVETVANPPAVAGLPAKTDSLSGSRHVLVLRPRVAQSSAPAPVLVALEYLHGTPADMADFTGIARLVNDYGIWVLVPEALDGKWNYGIGSLKLSEEHLVDQPALAMVDDGRFALAWESLSLDFALAGIFVRSARRFSGAY